MSWTPGGGVVFSQFLECINLIWERRKESVQKSRPACQCVENRPQWQTHKNDFGYFSKKRSHKKRSFNSQADRKGCPPPGHFLWFFGVRLISDYEYISLSEKKGGGETPSRISRHFSTTVFFGYSFTNENILNCFFGWIFMSPSPHPTFLQISTLPEPSPSINT